MQERDAPPHGRSKTAGQGVKIRVNPGYTTGLSVESDSVQRERGSCGGLEFLVPRLCAYCRHDPLRACTLGICSRIGSCDALVATCSQRTHERRRGPAGPGAISEFAVDIATFGTWTSKDHRNTQSHAARRNLTLARVVWFGLTRILIF
jgi:hypothetical protein